MRPKIVVLGGTVMDLTFEVEKLPQWKQATQAYSFHRFPGGKGLNQAIAASKLGGDVSIISAVGKDEFGKSILATLHSYHVNHEFVKIAPRRPTSVTDVFVGSTSAHRGEPSFVGWKGLMTTEVNRGLVQKAEKRILEADAILITLEVSLEAVEEIIRIAKKNNVCLVMLNPDPPLEPAQHLSAELLREVDVLVPDVWDALQLLKGSIDESSQSADVPDRRNAKLAYLLHAGSLQGMGIRTVCLITREAGCFLARRGELTEYPPFKVEPIDMTGVSDAFCAALAMSMVQGRTIKDSIDQAGAAGAIAMGKLGGSPSMPNSHAIREFLSRTHVRTGVIRRIPLDEIGLGSTEPT